MLPIKATRKRQVLEEGSTNLVTVQSSTWSFSRATVSPGLDLEELAGVLKGVKKGCKRAGQRPRSQPDQMGFKQNDLPSFRMKAFPFNQPRLNLNQYNLMAALVDQY